MKICPFQVEDAIHGIIKLFIWGVKSKTGEEDFKEYLKSLKLPDEVIQCIAQSYIDNLVKIEKYQFSFGASVSILKQIE